MDFDPNTWQAMMAALGQSAAQNQPPAAAVTAFEPDFTVPDTALPQGEIERYAGRITAPDWRDSVQQWATSLANAIPMNQRFGNMAGFASALSGIQTDKDNLFREMTLREKLVTLGNNKLIGLHRAESIATERQQRDKIMREAQYQANEAPADLLFKQNRAIGSGFLADQAASKAAIARLDLGQEEAYGWMKAMYQANKEKSLAEIADIRKQILSATSATQIDTVTQRLTNLKAALEGIRYRNVSSRLKANALMEKYGSNLKDINAAKTELSKVESRIMALQKQIVSMNPDNYSERDKTKLTNMRLKIEADLATEEKNKADLIQKINGIVNKIDNKVKSVVKIEPPETGELGDELDLFSEETDESEE